MTRTRIVIGFAVIVLAAASMVGGVFVYRHLHSPVRAEDLVGKWRMVRCGGNPPAKLGIKSAEIEIVLDGTWTAKSEDTAGLTFEGWGTWSLADDVLTYTVTNTAKSRVRPQISEDALSV